MNPCFHWHSVSVQIAACCTCNRARSAAHILGDFSEPSLPKHRPSKDLNSQLLALCMNVLEPQHHRGEKTWLFHVFYNIFRKEGNCLLFYKFSHCPCFDVSGVLQHPPLFLLIGGIIDRISKKLRACHMHELRRIFILYSHAFLVWGQSLSAILGF